MSRDSELKSDYSDIHEICRTGWGGFLGQATLDLDYYHRAQHTEKEAERAKRQDRDLFTIDKIGRQVNLLSGYEIRNRHILKIGPQGMPDEQEDDACRQHTGVVMSLMARANGYGVLSDAFKWGTLVQGSNLVEIYRDREGNLQFARLGYNQFLLNPGLTKTDLSDCDDILTGRWISEDKAKFLLPSEADKIDSIKPLLTSTRWDFMGSPELGNKAGRRLYEEWWRRKTEYVEMVISRVTGQEIPLKDFADRFYGGDIRFAKRRIAEMRLPNGAPALSRYSKPHDTIKLTVFVDDNMVWDGTNPLRMRDYNFIWFHGDWCPEYPRDIMKLQSYVRRLRDPQRARNRRINQVMDIGESQIQTYRVVRDKWLRNPEDAYRSGQGVVLHANEDFPDEQLLTNLIHQGTASDVQPGMFTLLEMLDKDETDVGGLNQEIFGSDSGTEIPAILGKFRTGQALTGQQGMFEGFRHGKRQMGIKLVRLGQLNYGPQKVAELINEMPASGFYDENLTRFDCMPVEGLLTDSQQMLFYLELKQLRATFPEAAQYIPLSEMVRYSPSPFKKQLIDMIRRAEQQQAQQMKQQVEDKQRLDSLIEAQTTEDIAQAEESRTGAALDRARTAAEINKLTTQPYVELIKEAMKLEGAKQKQRAKT